MKWEEMTSRERDAVVAEKVMEIKPIKNEGDMVFTRHRDWVEVGDWYYEGADEANNYFVDLVPPFTTDIAAAWLVVEKMRGTDDETFGRWMRMPELYERGEVPGVCLLLERSAAEAAPAVCLAALKAVGAI